MDQFSEWGGAQLCLRDVLSEARRRGWQAEVMAPGDGPLLSFARECGFEAHEIPLARYTNGRKSLRDFLRFGADIPGAASAVRRAALRMGADMIYANGPRVLPAIPRNDVPLVFHSHSLLNKPYSRMIARACLRRPQVKVLASSQFVAKPLTAMLGCDAVRFVYNGVPDLRLGRRNFGERGVRVGILGRIAPEKGHLDFVKAASALRAVRPDIQFAVIGASLFSDPDYERSILALGNAVGVEFCGWTDDISGALSRFDILAVPSATQEATPRVIVEAMSAGTPVVAYPSGGILELIQSGRTGILTDAPTADALARAILLLIDDPGLRARLSENGRREWTSRFTVERFQHEICDFVEAFATRGGRFVEPALKSAGDRESVQR